MAQQDSEKINIVNLMQQSGVGLGTSGAGGLVVDMSDHASYPLLDS